MKSFKPLRRLVLLGAACIVIGSMMLSNMMSIGAKAGVELETLKDDQSGEHARLDGIEIHAIAALETPERMPVTFFHDRHTDALVKDEPDCTKCHLREDGKLLMLFKRSAETDKQTLMDIYHNECIGCHDQRRAENEASGPVICGECHRFPDLSSNRQPMRFTHALHYQHVSAMEQKCDACHHQYDEEKKQLIYRKGEEAACRYCHKHERAENTRSLRDAFHFQCINCHINKKPTGNHGPIVCRGCHADRKTPEGIEPDAAQRIERKQPNTVLLMTAAAELDSGSAVDAVGFNHKGHEFANETCYVCHHKDLKSCSACHPLKKKTDLPIENSVRLEQAMHQLDAQQSCVGCHLRKTKEPDCAGCHATFVTDFAKDTSSCRKCHTTRTTADASATTEEKMALAEKAVSQRIFTMRTYPVDKIPETIEIKKLSNRYEAVELPHRKIVSALLDKINKSKLSTYFHSGEGIICKGCHHHAPPSQNPSRCGNCHTEKPDLTVPGKPGILGAYHIQCMGCHRRMNIEKPSSCTDCHREKKGVTRKDLKQQLSLYIN